MLVLLRGLITMERSSKAVEVAAAAPVAAVGGGTFLGLDLPDWVLVATLIYTIIQILLLLPHLLDQARRVRKARSCGRGK